MDSTKVRFIFNTWRQKVSEIKYDKWCEIQEKEGKDFKYPGDNTIPLEISCWYCKYFYCEIHK
jgi:hypothetical protein